MRREQDTQNDHGHTRLEIRLAVFDLDGTLTRPGTSVLRHIGQHFGFAEQANRLAMNHAEGVLTNEQVAEATAKSLQHRSRRELQAALVTLPMVSGIRETVEMLASRRVHCVLATITFDFAAYYIAQRFGFEDVMATALEWSPDDRVTGNVKYAEEAVDKCHFIRDQCYNLEIHESQVLVVGDTYTDLPAMTIAGFSIGLNPTPDVQRVATLSLYTNDLRDMIPHILHLLADPI
jgi:HAD superfamily phosphoserine phosphatase-like hydrolase